MKFLHAVGQISTERRPEFILLSDTLGLSMQVVALAQARASGGVHGATAATEATVEGPFYWPGADTFMWMCPGRLGWRPILRSMLPTGPSSGTG